MPREVTFKPSYLESFCIECGQPFDKRPIATYEDIIVNRSTGIVQKGEKEFMLSAQRMDLLYEVVSRAPRITPYWWLQDWAEGSRNPMRLIYVVAHKVRKETGIPLRSVFGQGLTIGIE